MKIAYKLVPLMLLAGCAHLGWGSHPKPAPEASAPVAVMPAASMPAAQSPEPDAANVTSGAGYVGAGIEPEAPKVVVKEVNPYQPITIRVTGTGAPPEIRSLTKAQRRLMSIRAAKLDAYRSIAEQVQGLKLVGNSTVANMVATSDNFRTYVDAYLRGVNIVSTTVEADGSSEVVATIVLDRDFYLQFKQALQQTGSVMKASQQNGAQGVQCGSDNCGARYNNNFYDAQ